MDRFGRPHFRGGGSSVDRFSSRPAPKQTGLLGAAPSRGSSQYSSLQDRHSRAWQNAPDNTRGSLLGDPPKRGSMQRDFGTRNTLAGSSLWQQENTSVPSEVRQLMQSFGLSAADMKKLSQLPENELSVNNLARAIGNLKQQRQGPSRDTPPKSYSHSTHTPITSRSRSQGYHDGLLGAHPGQHDKFSPKPNQFGSNRSSSQHAVPDRHKPTGIRVTLTPTGQYSDSSSGLSTYKSGNRHEFEHDRDDDDYDGGQQMYSRKAPSSLYDQSRNDSYLQKNRRGSSPGIVSREVSSKQQRFGNERHVLSTQREHARRGVLPRPVGTKSSPKSLLERPQQPAAKGLLGSPLQPSAEGLESLVASVGENSAASLLTPLVLASQTNPAVLEAQIQVMKTLQEQLQKQQTPVHDKPAPEAPRRRRRSPPMSRAAIIDRKMEEEARKEAEEMRAARGRVLYIRYKSPRISENDMRQLASAFGRVSKLLVIKPKVKNGHFQVFMELEQWDCAAAMLEHYMAKAPNIKGYPVDVKRSNYTDLQLRYEQQQRGVKRERSMSPIRDGTSQLPKKRERRSVERKSMSPRTSGKSDKRLSADEKEKLSDKRVDAREILNRSRSKRENGTGENNRDRRGSDDAKARKEESDKKVDAEIPGKEKNKQNDQEPSNEGAKKDENYEVEKPKEDIDPLDAIADELALHDEFMDNVHATKESVGEAEQEEKKNSAMDVDDDELDLDNITVEAEQNKQDDVVLDNQVKDEHTPVEDVDTSSIKNVKEPTSESEQLSHEQTPADSDIPAAIKKVDEALEIIPADHETAESASPEVEKSSEEQSASGEEDQTEEVDALTNALQQNVELKSLIDESLREIVCAKEHLHALLKVSRAKAVQSIANKLRVRLDVAITRLGSANST